jgi:hypothetical protein
MRGATPPLPQYVFMARCLVKHRDNLTLYLLLQQDEFIVIYIKTGQKQDIIMSFCEVYGISRRSACGFLYSDSPNTGVGLML